MDWRADLDFSNFSVQTVVNLSAKFTLSIVHEDYPSYALHPVITVDSVLNPQTNVSTVAEIERIQIKWGCVAADTLIKMSDGSCQRASEFRLEKSLRRTTATVSFATYIKEQRRRSSTLRRWMDTFCVEPMSTRLRPAGLYADERNQRCRPDLHGKWKFSSKSTFTK